MSNGVYSRGAFHQALDIARHQPGPPVAVSGQAPGRLRPAGPPVYGWFTEGFDTADLREAEALLQELEA